jgi:hypothetical protein
MWPRMTQTLANQRRQRTGGERGGSHAISQSQGGGGTLTHLGAQPHESLERLRSEAKERGWELPGGR